MLAAEHRAVDWKNFIWDKTDIPGKNWAAHEGEKSTPMEQWSLTKLACELGKATVVEEFVCYREPRECLSRLTGKM